APRRAQEICGPQSPPPPFCSTARTAASTLTPSCLDTSLGRAPPRRALPPRNLGCHTTVSGHTTVIRVRQASCPVRDGLRARGLCALHFVATPLQLQVPFVFSVLRVEYCFGSVGVPKR